MSNADLAELLESTRDRVQHMGGGAASAAGVVRVLDGLIAMLRDEAPQEDVESYATSAPAPEPVRAIPEPEPEPEPAPSRPLTARERRRLQQQQEAKPSNPLLSPQYAGFFNKLIADQKVPDPVRESRGEEDQPAQKQSVQTSSVKPQYRGFFDKLVQDQKPQSRADEQETATSTEIESEDQTASPEPEPQPRTFAPPRDETATG